MVIAAKRSKKCTIKLCFGGRQACAGSTGGTKSENTSPSTLAPCLLFFNSALKETLTVSGSRAIDETLFPFKGKSQLKVHIPRKPHPWGLRAYMCCFPLAVTGRPVVYHILPDLNKPFYRPVEVMEAMALALPSSGHISVTADSFFSSLGFLRSHPDLMVTFGCAQNDIAAFLPLWTHKLFYHNYRVFTDGQVVISLWKDNALVLTGSTAYIPIVGGIYPSRSAREAKRVARRTDLSGLPPILSEEDTEALIKHVSTSGLQAIAKRIGESSGNLTYLSQRKIQKLTHS